MSIKGIKYGDPKYKDRKPDRELGDDEILFLVATYKKTGSVFKAAESINIEAERAHHIVYEMADQDPSILTSPEPYKALAMALREISWNLLNAQRNEGTEKTYGKNRIQSAVYAERVAEAMIKKWAEAAGEVGAGKTVKEIEAMERECDAEIERLNAGRGTQTEAGTQETEAGTPTDRPMGEDA